MLDHVDGQADAHELSHATPPCQVSGSSPGPDNATTLRCTEGQGARARGTGTGHGAGQAHGPAVCRDWQAADATHSKSVVACVGGRTATRRAHTAAAIHLSLFDRKIDSHRNYQRLFSGAHAIQQRAHNTYSTKASGWVFEETRVAVTAVPSTCRSER